MKRMLMFASRSAGFSPLERPIVQRCGRRPALSDFRKLKRAEARVPFSVARALVAAFVLSCFGMSSATASAVDDALSRMPLSAGVTHLSRTNCVEVMLRAFQSNTTVKALVFMPGATDEFYMFRRAEARLTNASPTLMDAVRALTNQTHIRATFRAPALLLHTSEDPLDPLIEIKHQATAAKLRASPCAPLLAYNDRDWDFLHTAVAKRLESKLKPAMGSMDSWHFYRHSFAGWNLTDWETLECLARAGKSRFTVRQNLVEFECDMRYLGAPKIEAFPR
jgi:hypothetical protein